MVITVVRPADRRLQPVGPTTVPAEEQVKLDVIAETEPYIHIAQTPAGHVIAPHRHSQAEVTIILSGTAKVGDEVCGVGTVLIVPAEEEYGLEAGPEEPLIFAVMRPKKAVFRPSSES